MHAQLHSDLLRLARDLFGWSWGISRLQIVQNDRLIDF